MVDVSPVENAVAGSEFSSENSLVGNVENPDAQVVTTLPVENESTFEPQAVTPVVVEPERPDADVLLYVDSAVVNLRDGPGTNFKVLVQVQRGDELKEIDRVGGWVNVTTSNSATNGWILGRLVTTEQ